MTQVFFSKINKPLLVLSFVVLLAIGATKAYFTSYSQSPDNVFTSGSLVIDILQDEVLNISNWKPGETYTLDFSVSNTGSLPVHLKGYLAGEWSSTQLESSVVEILSIEREVSGSWQTVNTASLGVGEEFFLSPDGLDGSLELLEPNEATHFRFVVGLSPITSDEYQLETFVSSLHVAAKQAEFGAAWPSEY